MKDWKPKHTILIVLIACTMVLMLTGHPESASAFGTCAILWAILT